MLHRSEPTRFHLLEHLKNQTNLNNGLGAVRHKAVPRKVLISRPIDRITRRT
jgi:hypothetical protein